ncbi:hypothetical protein DAPPUDRAFT_253783 [Daphnia pulex]|uniref:Uncharacterized protein n=1 Tax=Daphnia pulex TaxID=6669 RepID=E9H5E4_DAPPU|nr:hypothetical protein DAPPUDRAFT_253783 [Daphnia pulex]|eukprot:EFX72946.1 hypothetical protein DAPPUDRAFT_253783 [Daphnia pulex]
MYLVACSNDESCLELDEEVWSSLVKVEKKEDRSLMRTCLKNHDFQLYDQAESKMNNSEATTFTSTQTLTLVSVVSCVPGDQVIDAPPARRKREDFRENPESDSQFEIHPSETINHSNNTDYDPLAN